jgi:fructose-specific phosphotransferase system IIA component
MEVLEISKYLSAERIVDLSATTKDDALNELMNIIVKADQISDENIFRKRIFERESLMSTGIGYEIAIPHARDKSISDFVIAIGRIKNGLEYESIDDEPVKIIFMIAASDKQDKDYIRLLSKLVLRLKNNKLKTKILNANTGKDIYTIIKETK